MSAAAARRSKVAKIRWAQGFRPNIFYRRYQENLYGLSPVQCLLKAIDEGSTLAQVDRIVDQLPGIERVLQPYRDSGQLQ